MSTPVWQQQVRPACAGEDPGLFFPPEIETVGERRAREGEARAICAGCPARRPCLEWATAEGFPWGIFGGADFSPHHGPECKNGLHPMDHANAWLDASGSLVCRACRKATEDRRPRRLANENREVA